MYQKARVARTDESTLSFITIPEQKKSSLLALIDCTTKYQQRDAGESALEFLLVTPTDASTFHCGRGKNVVVYICTRKADRHMHERYLTC